MNGTTTREDIFYEHALSTLACIVTDDVPAMMGIKNNCVERIKKKLFPKIHSFHCIIHQDVLYGKIITLEHISLTSLMSKD
jgi:hypothetical protein